jgi:glycine hydroxymethyltransferase
VGAAVIGDRSLSTPAGGVRIGTPALTSRGFKETDFVEVAEFLHRAVHLCLEIQVLFIGFKFVCSILFLSVH